jgi:hypothetical protein
MRKIHSLIIVMLLITCCAEAQISVGLKAGLNVANLSIEDSQGQKPLMGLAAGGLVNYALNDEFSIQPELLFSQEGTQWKDEDYEQKNRLNYFNIPILVQYRHSSGFFAHTGPQIGLLLSAKSKYKDQLPSIGGVGDDEPGGVISGSTDIKSFMSKAVISWALGAGYLHESGFGVNVRYNRGLSNSLSKNNDGKGTSSVFNIGVFYVFKSLKK